MIGITRDSRTTSVRALTRSRRCGAGGYIVAGALSVVAALGVVPQPASAAPTIFSPALTIEQVGPGQGQDPLTAARFSLVIDGIEIAAFNELVSIETEIATGATASADRGPASKQASQNPLPTVTLRRPLTRGLELWAWYQTAAAGQLDAARKNVTLIMYGTDGSPVVRFSLVRAYPSSLEMSAVKAGASEVLYETVTLVCDSLQRLAPS